MSITRSNPTVLPQDAQPNKKSTLWRFCTASWRTLWMLHKTLLLSILLGLILVFIAGMQPPAAPPHRLVVWAICLCMALAYGKVISNGNPRTVAGFALLGIVAALAFNKHRLISSEWVDLVRTAFYPLIGWTVCKLEQYQQAKLIKPVLWLFPFVVIPVVAGLLVYIDQQAPWKMLAEIVFAAGCSLILHLQVAPETQKIV